jgi:hypothetical protein
MLLVEGLMKFKYGKPIFAIKSSSIFQPWGMNWGYAKENLKDYIPQTLHRPMTRRGVAVQGPSSVLNLGLHLLPNGNRIGYIYSSTMVIISDLAL